MKLTYNCYLFHSDLPKVLTSAVEKKGLMIDMLNIKTEKNNPICSNGQFLTTVSFDISLIMNGAETVWNDYCNK